MTKSTQITVIEPGLVLLMGSSGSGKSTLARRLFADHEIVSLDECRFLVSGSRVDGSATIDAAKVAQSIIEARLRRRLLTVVDATNLRNEDRLRWISLAESTHSLVTAIVLDPGIAACRNNLASRDGDSAALHVLDQHHSMLRREVRKLSGNGVRNVTKLDSAEAISSATLYRKKTYNDMREVKGPFDIIGDVHGMTDELEALLMSLGWSLQRDSVGHVSVLHPAGRKLVFVGDLCDRGPRSLDALKIMKSCVESGSGYAVAGNHEVMLARFLKGRREKMGHGMDTTVAEMDAIGMPEDERRDLAEFLDRLPAHYVFDGGRLAVAHAGLKSDMILGASPSMREFAVFGEKTPVVDGVESVRYDFAKDYNGSCAVVYGHVPFDAPVWHNNTIGIDTGCVYGGELTALRWPENEIVSVPAERPFADRSKPFQSRLGKRPSASITHDDLFRKKTIKTSLGVKVLLDGEKLSSVIEPASRYLIDPRMLIYLPPTMSPVDASRSGDYLEHPQQAFNYYREHGIDKVITETKHMGSRAHLLVCRDAHVAERRFGVDDGKIGHIWTRNGQAFFKPEDRDAVLERLAVAVEPLFHALGSDWLLLDAEIMPWNAKASGLISQIYGPTGRCAEIGSHLASDALKRFEARTSPADALSARFERMALNADAFNRSWGNYTWLYTGVEDLKIAPFSILASEGMVHTTACHADQIGLLNMIIGRDSIFVPTDFHEVSLSSHMDMDNAIDRWLKTTSEGAEGIVVKPPHLSEVVKGNILQPALKVRGKDYLRLIYGVNYDLPENIDRLRERATKLKRRRALWEHSLGIEALNRFVANAPLRSVQECIMAILALGNDTMDPRL